MTTARSTRSLRLKAWIRGEDEALITIEAPPREEGTSTLRVGENLWNYLPRIAPTIRVPPSMMLGSWMGTDFTNDDLVKESSLHKDFASLAGRQVLMGKLLAEQMRVRQSASRVYAHSNQSGSSKWMSCVDCARSTEVYSDRQSGRDRG